MNSRPIAASQGHRRGGRRGAPGPGMAAGMGRRPARERAGGLCDDVGGGMAEGPVDYLQVPMKTIVSQCQMNGLANDSTPSLMISTLANAFTLLIPKSTTL